MNWDLTKWLTHEDVLRIADEALKEKRPLSFCRFGDGEACIVGKHLCLLPPPLPQHGFTAPTMEIYDTHVVWPPGLRGADEQTTAEALITCLEQADLLGLWWHNYLPVPFQQLLLRAGVDVFRALEL